jgi:F420-dependent oxidoreductase-like protein
VRFALMTEPQQGMSYDEILAITRVAEQSGFEAFFRSDHYASFPGEAGQPTTDAWTTLAGLARDTSRIGLGTLVSPVTFRLPGPFAKTVTTVDEMSGGRVEVGVGAGWNDLEHAQLGIPFPEIRRRFDWLEQTLAILHGLWIESDEWSYEGVDWTVRGALFRPRPVVRPGRRHPNIIVGGDGKPRSVRLAVTYADEYNIGGERPAEMTAIIERIRSACRDAGRDADGVTISAMAGTLVAETESELRDRVRQQLRVFGDRDDEAEAWLAERRTRWVMGTPDQARERVAEYERAGVERLMFQVFLPRDLEMVRLLGRTFLA